MSDDTALSFWCYAKRNDAAQVEYLLRDALVPVDDANDLGETALHLAASRGHDDVVRVLLQHDANLLTKDWESGWTPLHRSIFHDRLTSTYIHVYVLLLYELPLTYALCIGLPPIVTTATLLLLRHARVRFGKAFMQSYLHSERDAAGQSALALLSSRLADEFACTLQAADNDDNDDIDTTATGATSATRGGVVYTFGKADFQLGYHLPSADVQTSARPVALPTTSRVVQISASKYHTLAVTAAGECFVWGFGKGGRLGTGTEFDHVEPTRIAAFAQTPIAQVAAGESHSLALARTGHVYAWGANSFGQLGHSVQRCSQHARMAPKRIDALRSVAIAHVAVSGCHSAAIGRDDGAVYTWGSNRRGQLGRKDALGTDQPSPTPRVVDALGAAHPLSVLHGAYDSVRAVALALSDAHTSVVLQCARNGHAPRGDVWQFGYGSAHPTRIPIGGSSRNQQQQLSDAWVPSHQQLRGRDVVAIACAQHHSIALTACGAVYTWRPTGPAHQSPQSTQSHAQRPLLNAPHEVALAHFGRAVGVSASRDHCAVVTAAGDLVTWGCGAQNVLGHGAGTTWQPQPKRVAGVKKAVAVATGHSHTAVLVAPFTPALLPVASRSSSSCVPSLLDLLQQRIAAHVDLANCATLLQYAAALATVPRLEAFTRGFLRLNWDAVLDMGGSRERLFELLLPPLDAPVVVRGVTAAPAAALLDRRTDRRAKSRVSGLGSGSSTAVVALSTTDSASVTIVPTGGSDPTCAAAVASEPVRPPRRRAAKFVPLDQFVEPTTASQAAATVRERASPWSARPAASAPRASLPAPSVERSSVGRPRTDSVGSATASPLVTAASPTQLLAQDGSARQLRSTFSLDAFLKPTSARHYSNSNRKPTGAASRVSTNAPRTASWQLPTDGPTQQSAAPAKTLRQIQLEEQARAAADAAAKARTGSRGAPKTVDATVNSWGLCEPQRHVSLADVQRNEREQALVAEQHAIFAQIQAERAAAAAKADDKQPRDRQVAKASKKKTKPTQQSSDKQSPPSRTAAVAATALATDAQIAVSRTKRVAKAKHKAAGADVATGDAIATAASKAKAKSKKVQKRGDVADAAPSRSSSNKSEREPRRSAGMMLSKSKRKDASAATATATVVTSGANVAVRAA